MKKISRKKELLLLEKTAKIYHSITQGSLDSFWILDVKGRFLDANEAYCDLMGYSQKEILKMNVKDVEAGDKSKDTSKYLEKIKKTGEARFSTQHRKKDGTLVDIEVSASHSNDLGGLIFVFLRDVTKQKIIEKRELELVKTQAELKNKIEVQLADSYKHLGTINRRISLLVELDKYPKSKKERQKAIDHVLNLAMNLSEAPTGYIYGAKGRGKFNLLAYRGLKAEQKGKIEEISTHNVGLLRYLLKKKSLISGNIKRYEAQLLALDNKLQYFISLPLAKGNALGGFIFLGFDKKKNVAAQDLEFLDVFAMHASNALIKTGALE